MNKIILYTIAVDKNDNYVHIDNAEKGMSYYCPVCKKEFILRKSGKTGKGSRRPHFAHNELTTNCTPEGVLHYSFKKLLIDLLEKYKTENKSFLLNWTCDSCHYENSGNLLGKATLIKEEYSLGECRPDIALLDKEENVLAVIELVDTHKPEESALQYYKANKITFIQINLTSEEDLNEVEKKVQKPDIVDLCLSPKCQNSDKYKITRTIKAFRHNCGRCFAIIPRFEIEINSVFGSQLSRDFTEEEINTVKSNRNKIVNCHEIVIGKDSATKVKYPVVVCENCQMMRGRRNRFPL